MVTRSLGEIEAIFMTPLFHRSRRGLEPTPAGQLVLARARLALTDADALGQDLAALGSGVQGRLRIGVIPFLPRQTQDTLWQHVLSLRPRMGFVAEESTSAAPVTRSRLLSVDVCYLDWSVNSLTQFDPEPTSAALKSAPYSGRSDLHRRGRRCGTSWSRNG